MPRFWKPLSVVIPRVTITRSLRTRQRVWISEQQKVILLRSVEAGCISHMETSGTWNLEFYSKPELCGISLDNSLRAVPLKKYPIWLLQHPICMARFYVEFAILNQYWELKGSQIDLAIYRKLFLLSCHKNLCQSVHFLWVHLKIFALEYGGDKMLCNNNSVGVLKVLRFKIWFISSC